jgi:hypothetical protein
VILSLDNLEFYNRPQPDGPKEVVAWSSLIISIHCNTCQYLYGPLSSFQIILWINRKLSGRWLAGVREAVWVND